MIDRYFTQSKIPNRFQNGPIGPLFPSVHHSTGGPWLCGVFDSAHGPYSGSTREVVEGPRRPASGSEPGPRRVISCQGRRPDQRRNNGHLPQPARYLRTITELLKQQPVLNGCGSHPGHRPQAARTAIRSGRSVNSIAGSIGHSVRELGAARCAGRCPSSSAPTALSFFAFQTDSYRLLRGCRYRAPNQVGALERNSCDRFSS
jgi:hypothetical protein